MLSIEIIAIGKDKETWIADGSAHYRKLLSRSANVEFSYLPRVKATASTVPDRIKQEEAARFTKAWPKAYVVALTDRGKSYDTASFARMLERWQVQSNGRLAFLIGGPFGLHETILSRSNTSLSLSGLTMSHQLVRLVLLEQLYRAFDLLRGGSYHK